MKTGDILLVSGSDTRATLIQKFQMLDDKESGIFNHSGIIWASKYRLYVMEEAQIREKKLRAASLPTPLDHYLKGNYRLMVLSFKKQVDEFIFDQILLDNVAIPYDYWLLLHDKPKHVLGKIFPGKKKNTKNRMVCHEYGMEMWNEYSLAMGLGKIFPKAYEANIKDMYYHEGFDKKWLKK